MHITASLYQLSLNSRHPRSQASGPTTHLDNRATFFSVSHTQDFFRTFTGSCVWFSSVYSLPQYPLLKETSFSCRILPFEPSITRPYFLRNVSDYTPGFQYIYSHLNKQFEGFSQRSIQRRLRPSVSSNFSHTTLSSHHST